METGPHGRAFVVSSGRPSRGQRHVQAGQLERLACTLAPDQRIPGAKVEDVEHPPRYRRASADRHRPPVFSQVAGGQFLT